MMFRGIATKIRVNRGWKYLAFIVLGLAIQPAQAENVTDTRLLAAGSDAEAANWLTHHRTYDSHRFSPLDQINQDTAKDLKLAFAVPLGGWEPSELTPPAIQGTPLANDGFLYVTDGWGTVYKIDVRSG